MQSIPAKSFRLLRPSQKIVLVSLTVGRILVNSLDVAGIALLAVALTSMAEGSDSAVAYDWVPNPLKQNPTAILILVACTFLSKTLIGIVLSRQTAFFLARVEADFSQRIIQLFFLGNLSRVKSKSRAEIEWGVLQSTDFAFQKVLNQSVIFVAETSLAILIFSFMAVVDWLASLLITIYFALVVGLFQMFSSKTQRLVGSKLASSNIAARLTIGDLIVAFREITVLRKSAHYLKLFSEARLRLSLSNATHLYLQAIPRLIVETSLILGGLVVVAWELAVGSEENDFATLAILIVGSLRVMSALLPIQRSFAELRFMGPQATAAQEFLFEIVDSEENTSAGFIQESELPSFAGARNALGAELKDVFFKFGDQDMRHEPGADRNVISGVSLSIAPGSFTALVGPSGAGKSTLVDLILGLYKPLLGHVLIDGCAPEQLLAINPGIISYVPQTPGIVWGTVAQNIALGVSPTEIDEEKVWSSLRDAQLEDYVVNLPNGIRSTLGEHGDALSGGQIQRLGLARALYSDPRFLVLDEPTSSLDAATEASIIDCLKALRGRVTVLVVAHRLSSIQAADCVHVIEGGRLLASGTLADLRTAVPLIRKYVDLMSFE